MKEAWSLIIMPLLLFLKVELSINFVINQTKNHVK